MYEGVIPVLGTQPSKCASCSHAGHWCALLQSTFSVADFKAEKFPKVAHLLLSEHVIIEHTVFKCCVGESVLLKATSLCFENLLSRMFFAS